MTTQLIERMAVELDGEGTAVVMLHGLGGTSNTFTPQMPVLRSGYRVVRPDLPGAGRSRAPDRSSIGDLVQAVLRMCNVLGVEKAHFVGHSMGTIVCQHLAVERPSLVKSLSLFGALMEPPEQARPALKDRATKAREDGMADIADAIVQAATSSETKERNPLAIAMVRESLMRQSPEGYAVNCEALSDARAADIGRIGCPVLLVTGEEDGVGPPSVSRQMAEKLENGRSVILPRCGHWTTFERFEEVNRELRSFLASVR
ncbi:pimeloyl-ACP methyl ester carboxylesterase [Natronocella acetinitrilica]|uniref:Pimeloyl-ACP methyl ester carboxylesterase n=1 Tax=Natronocella acetinitrilica TaxID=414046 RepID=A0AAE3G4X6_9GAMM|nr:alpha/beta hydrolase [Natronocella acetinitrilica]MCP1674816.1 pimeloyl-ACP methyl ester carboxylesterase [Natronocella acetinitrilica]